VKLDPDTVRAAVWTVRAARVARRQLAAVPLDRVVVPAPPALPPAATRGVDGVLRRRRDTCLVQALVRQRWLSAQGEERDLVVGVTEPSRGFEAHAWLVGDDPRGHAGYQEIARRPAPG